MRKLKLVEHMSLDGVIEVAGGPGDTSDFAYCRVFAVPDARSR